MYPPVDGELAFKLAPGAGVEGAPPGGGSPPSAPPMDGGKPIGGTGTLPGPESTNFLNRKGWPKWPLIIFQFETKNGRSKSSHYSFFSAVEALSQTLNVLAFVRSLPVQCIATQAISKCAKIAPYGKICC